jgi:PqqD family protein of HPr-rel-A system
MLLEHSVVVALAEKQTSVALGGETVVLNMPSGNYYLLDEVGTRVWSLLRQPRSVAAIVAALTAEYDVDAATARADVLQFLEELAAEGLIAVTGAAGARG